MDYSKMKKAQLIEEIESLQQKIGELERGGVERRRAEEVLRESEERFRRLYERAPLGYQSLDAEGHFIDVNQAWLDLLGYSRDQVIGQWFGDFLASQELDSFEERFLRFKATGEVHVDVEMVQRAGSTILVHIDGQIGHDERGQFKQTHCILHDITERKRAEEALRESEERLRGLFETMAEGIVLIAPDGQIVQANPAAERILGLKRSEIEARNYVGPEWEILRPDGTPMPPDEMAGPRAMKEMHLVKDVIMGVKRPDGTISWINVSAAPLMDEADRLKGVVGTFADITERKRAEEELRQSYVNLQRALERTVHVLVSAIEMRDPYTAGHQRRVTQLACAIAREMGLPEEQIEGIRMAGLIHDLGKMNIPAEILSKPGQLTDLEFGLIQMHPQTGYDVLKTIEFPWTVAQIVLQHHERLDGSGYPQELSGEEIILEAKILGVADVVEAMASHRPYRSAQGIDKALEEISQNRGVLYDPGVVDACLKLFIGLWGLGHRFGHGWPS
jgi:PAS domain S-box-containing protein/putative nucleotidyltransferase with HDIG domain